MSLIKRITTATLRKPNNRLVTNFNLPYFIKTQKNQPLVDSFAKLIYKNDLEAQEILKRDLIPELKNLGSQILKTPIRLMKKLITKA